MHRLDAEYAAKNAMMKLVDVIVRDTLCSRSEGITKAKASVVGDALGKCISGPCHMIFFAGCSSIQDMYQVDNDTINKTPLLKALISCICRVEGIPQVTERTASHLVRLLRDRGQAEGWVKRCKSNNNIIGGLATLTAMTVIDDNMCEEDLYDSVEAVEMVAAFIALDSLIGLY
jgi:hypothetical protein